MFVLYYKVQIEVIIQQKVNFLHYSLKPLLVYEPGGLLHSAWMIAIWFAFFSPCIC